MRAGKKKRISKNYLIIIILFGIVQRKMIKHFCSALSIISLFLRQTITARAEVDGGVNDAALSMS